MWSQTVKQEKPKTDVVYVCLTSVRLRYIPPASLWEEGLLGFSRSIRELSFSGRPLSDGKIRGLSRARSGGD